MATHIQKLKQKTLDSHFAGTKVLPRGIYADGRNLYLRVNSDSGAASWVFIYHDKGKRFEEGLGSFTGGKLGIRVGLKEAREAADRRRVEIASGLLVAEHRPGRHRRKQPGVPSFEVVMEEFLTVQKWEVTSPNATPRTTIFRNAIHRYCQSILKMSVAAVDLEHVVECLKPIWDQPKGEATRLKIYQVLQHAQLDHRKGMDNPAAKATIDRKMGIQELAPEAREMLPWEQLPEFLQTVRASEKLPARAIELVVYSQMRSEAVRLAKWEDIDLDAGVWLVPAKFMLKQKGNRKKGPKPTPFWVPLCTQAINMLQAMDKTSEFVFAKDKDNLIGFNSMKNMCEQIGYGPDRMTVHGLRSTFASWGSARTHFVERDTDACLGHVTGQSATLVGRRYQRDPMVEKRRQIVQAYADFAEGRPNDNVLQFPKKEAV